MDLTAPAIPSPEHHNPPSLLAAHTTHLAHLIRQSSHFIVFTGAGVSTSAGIPDFRGPEGNWTKRAQGREVVFKGSATLEAMPTVAHMAVVGLLRAGLVKGVVSQNCDGLHRRSGVGGDQIAELHGNSNREYCKECGKEYIRDYRAVSTYAKSPTDHRTGRKCTSPSCPSKGTAALHDTIINFGEDLPQHALDAAISHAKKADLCLVLGSSLRVTPASSIPELVVKKGTGRTKKEGTLVICNLQDTPLDEVAGLRIYARTDELMVGVMRELGVEIPKFVLRRRLVVEVVRAEGKGKKGGSGSGSGSGSGDGGRCSIRVYGVDDDHETPVSFLRSVKLVGTRRAVVAEPFVFSLRGEGEARVELELEFMGHYGEPNLVVGWRVGDGGDRVMFLLGYDPETGMWETRRE